MSIRPARKGEGALVAAMIGELAAYERLAHEARADGDMIEAALFGRAPRVFCDLAQVDGEIIGFALWFYTFSTFVGRHGLWLEDLYVRPPSRGRGAGLALLRGLAERCVAEGLGRLDWAVLDWNEPAIRFYDRLGSRSLEDWRIRRLDGEALSSLARA